MFEEHITKSTIIEFVSEEETDETHRVVLRVKDEPKWLKLIMKMLTAAEEEESFGVSISKEYFLDNGKGAFVWVCIFWGELEDAVGICGPILSRRFGPPAPPKSVAVGAKTIRPELRKVQTSKVQHISGGVTAITVPLPHRRGDRDKDPDTPVKIGDTGKGIRAAVRGVK